MSCQKFKNINYTARGISKRQKKTGRFWFINSQQEIFTVAFNMEGKLLFTTDDLNGQFDYKSPKRTLEIIKENQESSTFELELDLDDIIL